MNNEKQNLFEDNKILRDLVNEKNREIANVEKRCKSIAKQVQVFVIHSNEFLDKIFFDLEYRI